MVHCQIMGWLVLESCEKGLQPCCPRLCQLWNFIWSSLMLSFGDSQPLLLGWLSNRRCPIILEGRECSVIFIANQLCWVPRRQVMHGHSAIVDGPWCHSFIFYFFVTRWHRWPSDQPWWMGLVMNLVAYIACSLLR